MCPRDARRRRATDTGRHKRPATVARDLDELAERTLVGYAMVECVMRSLQAAEVAYPDQLVLQHALKVLWPGVEYISVAATSAREVVAKG